MSRMRTSRLNLKVRTSIISSILITMMDNFIVI